MERLAWSRWGVLPALGITMGLVAACGGGGEGQGKSPPSNVSPDEEVAVGITLDPPGTVEGTNRIALSWRTEGAPTTFRVFVQRAAGEAFVAATDAVTGNATAQFARGAAWAYDWPTARVRVRACDAQQRCADSNEQPLLDALAGGLVKLRSDPLPENGGYYDRLAFSHDGSTLSLGTTPIVTLLRAGDGRWAQDDTALPRRGERFALSGDGNTLAVGLYDHRGTVGGVGAPEEEPPPGPDSLAESRGAVAVYVRVGGAWQQQTFVKADVPTDREFFGWNVALSGNGNHMAVSTQAEGDARIYLYERQAGVWRFAWQFRKGPFRLFDSGPAAISADGRTIAVRTYRWYVIDNPGGYGDGDQVFRNMVQIYRQCTCSESWELAAEFESPRDSGTPLGSDDDYAGTLSLSADGKTLAVGAGEDDGGAGDDGTGPNQESRNSGAVYIFGEGPGRRWERRAFIKTSTAPPWDYFGSHVQLRADGRAFVASACGQLAQAPGLRRLHRAGALPPDVSECGPGGNFYVFEEDGGGRWRQTAAALVSDFNRNVGKMGASADLETIGVQTFTLTSPVTGRYDTAIY